MMMLYSMMMGNNNNAAKSGSGLLPLLLMQERSEGGAIAGGDLTTNDSALLEIMIYKPIGSQILDNFANKIQNMTITQRNRLMACSLLDMLGKNQTGKLWETMLLAAHGEASSLLGDPLSSVVGAVAATPNVDNDEKVDVGAQTLGSATQSVKDKAKALDLDGSEGTAAKKDNNNSKMNRTVIVT